MAHGYDLSFSAEPDDEHEVTRWLVDGDVVQWGSESYTLSDIQSDHSVSVLFGEVDYTITATAGLGGSVSPSDVSVYYGDDCMFTATPKAGYVVNTWSIDGSVAQTGGVTYEVSSVYDGHTIHVTFKQALSYSLGIYEFEDEEEFEASVLNNNEDQPDKALVSSSRWVSDWIPTISRWHCTTERIMRARRSMRGRKARLSRPVRTKS